MPHLYTSFKCRNAWRVHFHEGDLKTSLRKHLTFASEEKIVGPAKRSGAEFGFL
jgi:hypothetical protein